MCLQLRRDRELRQNIELWRDRILTPEGSPRQDERLKRNKRLKQEGKLNSSSELKRDQKFRQDKKQKPDDETEQKEQEAEAALGAVRHDTKLKQNDEMRLLRRGSWKGVWKLIPLADKKALNRSHHPEA